MQSFLVSTLTVGAAELGDKTQLLTLLFAARFKKPVPIIAAILVATLLNHGITAWAGVFFSSFLSPLVLHAVLTVSFLGTAAWALIPDKLDEQDTKTRNTSIFLTVLITFFIAELGDKTQVITLALSAQYQAILWVTLGTTLGMMLANVPAVFLGRLWCEKLPFKLIRIISAFIFIGLASYEAYQFVMLL